MKSTLCSVLVILFIFISPIHPTERAPYPDADQWPVKTPDSQGIDGKRIDLTVKKINANQSVAQVNSLLIVKNGFLVSEHYFNGYSRKKVHTMQSVSKSVTSALIGIAMDKGIIKGVDQKVLGFFPKMKGIKNMDSRKKDITLKDLLTMRSGTDYHERGPDSPHHQLNRTLKGWDRFYLNRPMISQPGTTFLYDSGAVILMSAVLKNRCDKHADQFAEEHLFPELGIKEWYWLKNLESHPHTGGGLVIRPFDMAKFGLLYLREGRWKDKQLISKRWIKESLKMHVKFNNTPGSADVGYGYWWWIMKAVPGSRSGQYIYAAKGFMGQYICLIPEFDMMVVFTGSSRDRKGMNKCFDYLYDDILPAVISTRL